MSWIELPQLRDMTDLIRITYHLRRRHFDKILLYIDVDELQDEENFNSDFLLHQIEFFGHVFGQHVINSMVVYFKNSTDLTDLTHSNFLKLEKVIRHVSTISYSTMTLSHKCLTL